MILPAEPAPPANASELAAIGSGGQLSDQELLRQQYKQMSQISRCVSVSNELTQIFSRFQNLNE
jgi:hypothetical protein